MKKNLLVLITTSFACVCSLALFIYSTYDMVSAYTHYGLSPSLQAMLILNFLFFASMFLFLLVKVILQVCVLKKLSNSEQSKSERIARKQEKAEADKQKRLEKLQAEIEELKRE